MRRQIDANIQAQLLHALHDAPRLDPAHVGVSVRDGIVRLVGYVRTAAEKQAVETIASGVGGVRSVIDDLFVERADRHLSADEALAEAAYARLAANTLVSLDRLHISVSERILTARGEVDNAYQWEALDRELTRIPGVGEIRNRVLVASPAGSPVATHGH